MTTQTKSFLEKWGTYIVPMLLYIALFAYGYGNLNATVASNKTEADKDRESILEQVKTLTTDFKDFMKEYRRNEKRREDQFNDFYKQNKSK